ncbi:hypothetical protein [Sphingomonas morindae]|uniref:Uncharacterized protein n=1 Tax=Sphingomonas morindae TaxID=1541170 RepID=A0ABY4X448_9SPHN|nr:hypothetical protein [Sphingomonas morindae]USI71630.1 hypothetical protein LHA26_09805 [Sphingomonas morindae]
MSAALIQRLIEAGTPAGLVAEVALELGRAARLLDAEAAADRAREAREAQVRHLAAERQRRKRAADAAAPSRVTRVTLRDERDADPAPNKSPLEPQKLTPTPGVCVAHAREADPIGVPTTAAIAAAQAALGVLIAGIAAQRAKPDYANIAAAWNAMAARAGLPRVEKLTEERRKRIGARLAEHGADGFTEAIAAVERSSFCRGDSGSGWRADFDFLLQPSSFNRLLEGSYDRNEQPRSSARSSGRSAPGSGPGRTVAARDRVIARMAARRAS